LGYMLGRATDSENNSKVSTPERLLIEHMESVSASQHIALLCSEPLKRKHVLASIGWNLN